MSDTGGLPFRDFQAALSSVERFTGQGGRTEDAHVWINTIEELADASQWIPTLRLKVARLRLGGAARIWLDGANPNRVSNWEIFQKSFLDRFGEKRDAVLARLANCIQQRGEAVQEYADRFRNLARRAGRADDEALSHQFVKGLRNFLRRQVVLQRMTGIEEIIDYVIYLDEWDENYDGLPSYNSYRSKRGV